MDPITAGLTLANSIVILATKIWDATPDAAKATRADDMAQIAHNCSAFLQSVQAKINAVVVKPAG